MNFKHNPQSTPAISAPEPLPATYSSQRIYIYALIIIVRKSRVIAMPLLTSGARDFKREPPPSPPPRRKSALGKTRAECFIIQSPSTASCSLPLRWRRRARGSYVCVSWLGFSASLPFSLICLKRERCFFSRLPHVCLFHGRARVCLHPRFARRARHTRLVRRARTATSQEKQGVEKDWIIARRRKKRSALFENVRRRRRDVRKNAEDERGLHLYFSGIRGPSL